MHIQFNWKRLINTQFVSLVIILPLLLSFTRYTTNAQIDLFNDGLKAVDEIVNKPLLKLTAISDEEENQIGAELQKKVAKDYKKASTKKFDISTIFNRLKAKVSRKKIKYEVKILNDDSFNAFAIAGGKNFLFTGLLDRLSSEDEVAFVLAHEIAHNELKHCIERIQYAARAEKINPILGNVVQIGYNVYQRPFSQGQEYAADDLAVKIMTKAGFNKSGAVEFFSKLENMEKEYQDNQSTEILNDFISTHPTAKKRKERIINMK